MNSQSLPAYYFCWTVYACRQLSLQISVLLSVLGLLITYCHETLLRKSQFIRFHLFQKMGASWFCAKMKLHFFLRDGCIHTSMNMYGNALRVLKAVSIL